MSIFTHLKQKYNKSKNRQEFENKHRKLKYPVNLNQLWSPEIAKRINDEQLKNLKYISRVLRDLHQDLYHTLNNSLEVDELIERYVKSVRRYRQWKSLIDRPIWVDKDKRGSKIYKRDAYIFAQIKRNMHGDIPLYACPTGDELKNVDDIQNMLMRYKNTFTLKDIVDNGDEYEFRFEINTDFVTQGNPHHIYNLIELNEQKGKTPVVLGESNANKPIIWDLNKSNTILMSGNHQSEYQKMIKDMMVSLMMFSQSQQEMTITLISDSKRYDDIHENHAYIRRLTSNANPHHFIEDLERDIERRDSIIKQENCKDIEEFNRDMHHRNEKTLSKHVIIIDDVTHFIENSELNEMIGDPYYSKLGIYFIIACYSDYRVSPYVLSQAPSRIAMQVNNKIQSEKIINQYGAEKLRSNGEFYAISSNAGVYKGLGQILDTNSELTKSHGGSDESTINKIDRYVKKDM